MMMLQENILPLVTQLNTRLNNKEEIMSQFTKSFLWRFILDIILLGIFVRLLQSVILAILSRSMETYDDVDYVYDKYAYNNIKHINEEIL